MGPSGQPTLLFLAPGKEKVPHRSAWTQPARAAGGTRARLPETIRNGNRACERHIRWAAPTSIQNPQLRLPSRWAGGGWMARNSARLADYTEHAAADRLCTVEGRLRVVQRRPRLSSQRRQHLSELTVRRPTSARRRIADLPRQALAASGRPQADAHQRPLKSDHVIEQTTAPPPTQLEHMLSRRNTKRALHDLVVSGDDRLGDRDFTCLSDSYSPNTNRRIGRRARGKHHLGTKAPAVG